VLPDGVARLRTLRHRSRRVARVAADSVAIGRVASQSRCDAAPRGAAAPTFALVALAARCVPKKA
jgi:hypothetical protein